MDALECGMYHTIVSPQLGHKGRKTQRSSGRTPPPSCLKQMISNNPSNSLGASVYLTIKWVRASSLQEITQVTTIKHMCNEWLAKQKILLKGRKAVGDRHWKGLGTVTL